MDKKQEKYTTEIDTEFAKDNSSTVKSLARYELFNSFVGKIIAILCILGGIILVVNGVAGSTSWTTKILGAESSINDATPGVVLFIVGLLVLFLTNHSLKVKKT